MTAIPVLLIAPQPAPLYHIVEHPDRAGWYQVIEGDHVGAPVIANCPAEAYALAVCNALNEKRDRAIGARRADVTNPLIIGDPAHWN